MNLHLGCGAVTPETWTNVDFSAGARAAKIPGWRLLNRYVPLFATDWSEDVLIHDLRKRLPWSDGSISGIYTSHTLEHLTKEQGRHLLGECFRVLAKGALIRVVVPDLSVIIARYAEGSLAADDFVDELGVRLDRSGGLLRDILRFAIGFPHQCMYDTQSLLRLLTEVGFSAEKRQAYDSGLPNIADVEMPQRVVDAVIVEGIKI